MAATDPRLILLDERDNVLVLREGLRRGTTLAIGGDVATLALDLPLGHKIARGPIAAGAKILKYGAPIGKATCAIAVGEHVHVHNVVSDYTPTYHLVGVAGRDPGAGA
jgi:altronate dehydratase small subunit